MNELILLLTAAASAAFVFVSWRLGKERLYNTIVVFLILIASVGGKIVVFAGHATNTGNVFYASIFLATYFLIERYGKREGIRSIWIGVLWVLFFSVLIQLSIRLISAPGTESISNALTIAFSPVPRVALASLIAYIASQTLNVYVYIWLKEKMDGKRLWLRANLANLAAQILDSIIFFTVAFAGVALPANLNDFILTGLTIKILYMACASLLLYFNVVEEDGSPKTSTVVFRYDR